jgi:hypothetical protein
LICFLFVVLGIQFQTGAEEITTHAAILAARQAEQKSVAANAEKEITALAEKAPATPIPSIPGSWTAESEMMGDIGKRASMVNHDQFLYLFAQRKAALARKSHR